MRSDHYILEPDGSISVEPDLLTWANWFENTERHIGSDGIPGAYVSTVFLGVDHNFGPDGPPLLFETMIFGGPHDQYQERYATKAEAIAGHAKALALAKGEAGELRRELGE